MFAVCTFLFLLGVPALLPAAVAPRIQVAPAQGASQESDRIAALEQRVTDAQSAGDNAWMLVSSAFVLLMTGPGLALFYGGLVRKKNILGTMMQSFALMAFITVLWALFGYSLCFAPGNSFIGGTRLYFPAQRRRRAQSNLCRHHPAANVHDLSADVRHHHAGLDLPARSPSA